MRPEIRRAEREDAEALTQIAHAAKRHWGYPERWIAEWRDTLTITPDFIAANGVYLALEAGEPAGFYALVGDGSDRIVLEHMWVSPEHIGTGLGRKLFEHAVRKAGSLEVMTMEIESDPNAEGFYRRMGARLVGESISVIDGQPRSLPRLVLDLPSAADAGGGRKVKRME